ncbi:MAG: hypothetical protein STHCBS139747_001658 [Sporothrix thermara]
MADDRQSARRQVAVSVRATGQTDRDLQQDQRQHIAGGQPLPPDASMAPSSMSASSGGGASSIGGGRRRPSDLSSYAHAMLQHTKQQMDATNGSPPPAHLRVAGPAGAQRHRDDQYNGDNDGSRSHRHRRSGSHSQSPSRSQHHHRISTSNNNNNYSGASSRSSSIRHGHRMSTANGTTSALPNGI